MSRFFPHTAYAEDQPLAHTILTTHVLTRAATAGALVGSGVFATRATLRAVRKTPSPAVPFPAGVRFLRASGVGTASAVGLLSVALVARMWGREEIEWKDRAWRLLENKGQLETDDWTCAGMAAGLAGAVLTARRTPMGWTGVVGGMGTGSVVGMVGYLAWRYGANRGKFPE